MPRGGEGPAAARDGKGKRVLHVTSFKDPMQEMDKLHGLYEAVMDARRTSGQDVVPFHKFAALVRDQVKKIRDTEKGEVSFKVTRKDGKVALSAKGKKS